jgi:hypothetical protein
MVKTIYGLKMLNLLQCSLNSEVTPLCTSLTDQLYFISFRRRPILLPNLNKSVKIIPVGHAVFIVIYLKA